MTDLEIWAPRYKDNTCLILAGKVKSDSETYRIWFSKADHLAGDAYIMSGSEIKELGSIERTKTDDKVVYAVPMLVLERFKEAEVL